jgi:hypothetical protein
VGVCERMCIVWVGVVSLVVVAFVWSKKGSTELKWQKQWGIKGGSD